jgi:HPr kinase/phosphorylase
MAAARPSHTDTLHASCVALKNRAVLITGASGAGKSALALGLMARGAALVSDDRTILTRRGSDIVASCPEPIHGLIEARGVGILNARPHPPTPVFFVVDLDHEETDRLPPHRDVTILSISLPLIYRVESSHFIDAVLLYLSEGRSLR